jgi:hypothetical protein
VFHERECEEVFKTQWHIDRPVSPFAGNWDNNCWDYISKDGQTWIGSNKSGFSSTASSSSSGGSSSNTVFHESECKEVWQKYGSGDAISKSYNATTTQQWDMKCWGYVSKDGKRWIGSKSGRSSTVAQVPTTKEIELAQSIETKKLDLEFWQSVKDSNDAEMYSEYLRQFPRGVYAGLARIKLKKLGVVPTKSSIPNLDYGRYHALVIGNDRYRHLKKLSTAVNDAKSIASLLHSQYGFEVNVLTNATRNETVSALSELRQKISPKDNLLVYYAGHGWLDKAMDEGFWLPVDAVEDNPVEWLSYAAVVGMVRAMKAKHVMVVADSCFSGTLVRGLKIKERSPDYIQRMVKKKARTALTSGGLEPVTDVGGGNHSVFAQSFMRILNENDGVLDGHQLFTTLRRQVMMGADQTPEYGDIRKAGHDGGDFLFVRQ